jgi:hypothetical protein
VVTAFIFTRDSVQLDINRKKQAVSTKESQQLEMVVKKKDDQQPLANVEATLKVHMPDDTLQTFHFLPTGEDGKSSLTLPAMPGVENGSVIAYDVCLNVPSDAPICTEGTFLIWDIH